MAEEYINNLRTTADSIKEGRMKKDVSLKRKNKRKILTNILNKY
jgi:hypothetical protein